MGYEFCSCLYSVQYMIVICRMNPSLKLAAKKHRALKVGIKRVKKFTIKMDATVIFYIFLHTLPDDSLSVFRASVTIISD